MSKTGTTPNQTVPAAQLNDITTSLAQADAPPAPPPSGIRVESVPNMVDEMSLQDAFNAFRKMVREFGRDVAKRWDGMPARFKPPLYVYYRCGIKGDPQAEFLRAEMTQHGWMNAPAGTYCTQFMTDRGHGVYVCTPAHIYRQYHEFENELIREKNERALRQRKKATVEALRDVGVEIEGENVRHETMTAEEFMGTRDVVHRK